MNQSRELEEEIRELAEALGVDRCAFADVAGYNSFGYPRAVSLIVTLLNGVVEQISDAPTYEYYSHYKAVNDLINNAELRIGRLLEKYGYSALSVAASQSVGSRENYASAFSHKLAATRSGSGYVGKSGLFIHNEFGPRVRLGTVLTDAPLSVGVPKTKSECGACRLCELSCPASAIVGADWYAGVERKALYDPAACSEFMKNHFGHIGNGFVCGICMRVCPKSR